MDFVKISNEFSKLALSKGFQNGLYLDTLLHFYAICKLIDKAGGGEVIIQDVANFLHQKFEIPRPNSANLTRHNNNLIRLGLVSVIVSVTDGRAKNIKLTTLGEKFKRQLFN